MLQKALADGKFPVSGQYTIRDTIDGHMVEMRGAIVNNVVKIGTAFVDTNCC